MIGMTTRGASRLQAYPLRRESARVGERDCPLATTATDGWWARRQRRPDHRLGRPLGLCLRDRPVPSAVEFRGCRLVWHVALAGRFQAEEGRLLHAGQGRNGLGAVRMIKKFCSRRSVDQLSRCLVSSLTEWFGRRE